MRAVVLFCSTFRVNFSPPLPPGLLSSLGAGFDLCPADNSAVFEVPAIIQVIAAAAAAAAVFEVPATATLFRFILYTSPHSLTSLPSRGAPFAAQRVARFSHRQLVLLLLQFLLLLLPLPLSLLLQLQLSQPTGVARFSHRLWVVSYFFDSLVHSCILFGVRRLFHIPSLLALCPWRRTFWIITNLSLFPTNGSSQVWRI